MMSKYSTKIDLQNTNSAHTKILNLVGRDKKVVEFGCSSGFMSEILKKEFGCEVVGIELNPEDAKEAKAFCKQVIIGDIEKFEWCDRLPVGGFDVAIFADVLEHLKNPATVLQRVKPFLEENGYILVSVPNIANLSIRLELLLGSFEYEELGILDDTHLKYFTLKSLMSLVEGAGYSLDSMDAVVKDVPESVIRESLRILDLHPSEKTVEYLSGIDSLAYQFVVKALHRTPDRYVQMAYRFKEIKKPEKIVQGILNEQGKQLEKADHWLREKDQLIQAQSEKLDQADRWLREREQRVEERDSLIQQQDEKIREKDRLIQEKTKEILVLEARIREKETSEFIQSGDAWRLLRKYYRIRDLLLPAGTRRRTFIKSGWNMGRFIAGGEIANSIKRPGSNGIEAGYRKVKERLKSEIRERSREAIGLVFPIGTNRRERFKNLIGWKSGPGQLMGINCSKKIGGKSAPKLEPRETIEEKIIPEEDSNISVIIPTFNGAKDLTVLLPKLNTQKGLKSIEIVVVDSGSNDGSVQISRNNSAKVIEISPAEFSHSFARNLGAENATQKYLLFMVQDALPSSEWFIYHMLRSLKKHSAVAASCCDFLKMDADLFAQVQQWGHHRFLAMDGEDKIMSFPEKKDYVNLRRNSQLSDVACLIEKEVFLRYKYQNDFAEDLDLGLRLIKDNYKLVGINTTKVIHSHTRPAYYILKRSLVDCVVLSKLFPDFPKPKVDNLRFCEDIAFMYGLIEDIALKRFFNLKLPCKSDLVQRIVNESFESAVTAQYPKDLAIMDASYVDSDFTNFLRSIKTQCDPNSATLKYSGRLLADMRVYSNMVFEYLRQITDTVDDYRMKEVIACLFKILAIVIGTHLSFYDGSQNLARKEFFLTLKHNLMMGV